MYYTPTGFAEEIFRFRHALHEAETFSEGCDRVAQVVSVAEGGPKIAEYREKFSDLLKQGVFSAGGRTWFGAGRPKGQLLNCFVSPTDDSREGWGRSTSDLMIISGTGGGVGFNFSPIRPRGTDISGTGGKATGAVSLMRIKNAVGQELKAGGGRRVAMMHALDIDHPDIDEFLDAKLDSGALNNANVSVVFRDNPETFFELVKAGKDYDLRFGGQTYGTKNAQEIWERIVTNAISADKGKGEPGVLNGYLANRMSNVWYYAPLICTNPCGEIWLPAYDCCDLGSLVLSRFVKSDGTFDWKKLEQVIPLAVRFLDDVLTVNHYPLPEIKNTCSQSRRIGLGVMGLATMLLKMGYRYDSPAGLEFVNRLFNRIKNLAYQASIDLAKEKGPFPKFDPGKFLRSGFVKQLKPSLREQIRQYGIRNCAALTLPPTGTTAMVQNVDSGCEPIFGPAHIRTYLEEDIRKQEVVLHPLFKEAALRGEDVSHFQSVRELPIRAHFEMQRVCQRHIDNAVSKTINLPPDVSYSEMSDLYMEFLPDLKGITLYPEGSRENQPITPLRTEEALQYLETGALASGPVGGDACRLGGDCG